MAIKYTKNQDAAMKVEKGNIIVSASAGSGKTAVLTERVYKAISSGEAKLSELLVLTFTDLAASQMREKIREKLTDADEDYSEVLASLDAAHIQTFDSFALNIVQRYYYRLSLDKDFSFIDASILKIQEKKIVNRLFDEYFEAKDPRVLKLIDDYCVRDKEHIVDFIINVSHKYDLKENKQLFLDTYFENFFSKEKFKEDVYSYINEIKTKLRKYRARIEASLIMDFPFADPFLEIVNTVLDIEKFEDIYAYLTDENFDFPRKPTKDLDPEDNSLVEETKKEIKKLYEHLCFPTIDEMYNHYLETKGNVEIILEFVKKLDTEIKAFKEKHSVYTFNDVAKFALDIVSIPEIRDELKNKFKYIMVDEYQDTSDLQENLLNKISNNNIYVVGDVKQSIYRFRNANCDLFLDKFNRYGKGEGGKRIELPDNFRSRKEVVDTINDIFIPLLTPELSGLDYQKEHLMIQGNKLYGDTGTNYQSEVIAYEKDDAYTSAEQEARLIAIDIIKKMDEGFKVHDFKNNEDRELRFSDIAILSKTKGDFELYRRIFNEYKIPLYAQFDKSMRNNDLTLIFKNIIALLSEHPSEEKSEHYLHSFISVVRSFVFCYKDSKIADLANNKDYPNHELYKIIDEIYSLSKNKSLKEIVSLIVDKFDLYNKLPRIGNIVDNISLLENYYQIASNMDKMGYSLDDFKQYFDDLEDLDIDSDYKPSEDVSNCVNLLTIHASKGLQFKLCYFPQIYKKFNSTDTSTKLIVDNNYGILIPNTHHTNVDTVYRVIRNYEEKYESILEQLRLFYVALTRAEEKIVLLVNINPRIKAATEFSKANRFYDFYMLSGIKITERTIDIEQIERKVDLKQTEFRKLVVKEPVKLSQEVIENKHASKELDDDVDNELLLLGNKYHYYLELVDFSTLDTFFISDELDRRRITRFLSNDLFKNMKDANVMHEYPFYDEEENIHGVIDLLVEHSDHIDIVDFKLSHVDDEQYEKQLNTYKRYVSKITKKPIKMYLTGILSGEIKEVN